MCGCRHLDTSLLDVDVQPTYVKVTVKGKVRYRLSHEKMSFYFSVPSDAFSFLFVSHYLWLV